MFHGYRKTNKGTMYAKKCFEKKDRQTYEGLKEPKNTSKTDGYQY